MYFANYFTETSGSVEQYWLNQTELVRTHASAFTNDKLISAV